jgi:uncharacterized repeat protein (TIGR02543 family)
MRIRWLNTLVLFALVLGTLPFSASQSSVVAATAVEGPMSASTPAPQTADPPPVLSQRRDSVDKRLRLEPFAEEDVVVRPNLALRDETLFVSEDASGRAIYLIRLEDEPLASYRGGIAGLAPTSPALTNARGLNADSPEVVAYTSYLGSKRADFLTTARAALGRRLDVVYEYYAANNGLAVRLTPEEAASVAALPGVAFVQRDVERELHTDNGPSWIGAPTLWDGSNNPGGVGSQGEGVVIGIIDTGINYSNPSFAAVGPVDGYVHSNPLGAGIYLGDCASGESYTSYCNDKLIGVRGYATVNGGDPVDWDGHGSHTAGTAAGNIVEATIVAPTTTIARTISGVAPHANIIAYNACCTLSALTAAIDDIVIDFAVILAADPDARMSVNYSIGSQGPSDVWNDFDTVGYLNAREAGIFVATSAGNSGPGAGTVGSPADAPWLTSVGATTHDRRFVNEVVSMSGGTTPPADMEGAGITQGYGPAPVVYAGNYGDALCLNPFAAATFTGQIVICDRGTNARVDKGANVLAGGAGGMILADDGNGIVGDAHFLPTVHVSQSNGAVLKAWLTSGSGHQATISGTYLNVADGNGDMMAGFSSRGANRALPAIIVPSVAAPGVSILAAYGTNNAIEWNAISGTSMASPHVAGAAALLMALHPDWTPAEVQSALMTTAWQTVVKEDGTTSADPFDMGSGRVDLTHAAKVGLVLDETIANYWAANPALGGDPTNLNLASLASQTCVGSCSWTRTFRSVLEDTVTYSVTATAPAGMDITVDPATFTIPGGGTQVLNITVDADLDALTPGDWAFAQLSIQRDDGATVLLQEDFTAETFPPTAWTVHKLQGDGTTTWIRTTAQSHSAPASARRIFGGSADGNQDDWLVTPPIAIDDNTWLSYFDRGQWMADYVYSGVWLSTASCDPADGEFVELLETDDIRENAWRATPVRIDLSAYVGETACLAFRYSGDFAHTWWIDDILVEASTAVVHRLPIAVRPVSATPIIDVTPEELISVQLPEQITTHNLTIANEGGLNLEWEFGDDTVTIAVALWDQSVNGGSGIVSDFFIGSGAGAYSASDFVLSAPADISYIFAAGFDNSNSLSAQPAINWAIYADDGGVPAGHPEDGTSMASALWAYSAAVNAPGVDITDNDIALDLLAAGETLSLLPGTYWLTIYPSYNVTGPGGARWNWSQAAQVGAQTQLVSPGIFGVVNWTALSVLGVTFGDTAFRIEASAVIVCEHPDDVPWLAAVPTIGTTPPESSTGVTVYLDSSGMAPGSHQALLCIESNDPETPLVVVPVEMIVEAAAEIEVTPGTLSSMQPLNAIREETLIISNAGIADLEWEIEEDDTSAGLLSMEVLYDQTGNTTSSGVLAIYDLDDPADWAVQAADDFVVPAGETWFVESIFAGGFYAAYVNPPQGVNVFIYADNGGLPGDELYAYPELSPTADVAGDLTLDLPTAATLTEGTYWVSVQPRMDYFGDGRWLWLTESAQRNSEFAWRNPGNGYGSGCVDWGSGSDCGFANPDLTFRILGERTGPCLNPSQITWLSVNPASGTTLPGESDDIVVTFDATGLAPGEYEGNLCVFSNDPLTPLVVVSVSMEVFPVYMLDVVVTPTGSGTVAVSSNQMTYAYGDEVTLTATANPGWVFTGWTGGATGTNPVVTVTIVGNTGITATFAEVDEPVYRIMLPFVRRN